MRMLRCLRDGQYVHCRFNDIQLLREWSREGKLYCPECGGVVHYRNGSYSIPHFYHKTKSSCSLSHESEEHLIGKLFIEELLKKQYSDGVECEVALDFGARADVLLKTPDKTFAFEIQFSEQTAEEWKERTKKYTDNDVVPVWILGYKKSLTDLYEDNDKHGQLLKLGRTREYALNHKFYPNSVYQNTLEGHVLTVVDKIPTLYYCTLRKEASTTFSGEADILDDNGFWDEECSRFVTKGEIVSRERLRYQKELCDKAQKKQEALRIKVVSYFKVNDLSDIDFFRSYPECFPEHSFTEWYPYREYDFQLLFVSLYVKFLNLKHSAINTDDIFDFVCEHGFFIADCKEKFPKMREYYWLYDELIVFSNVLRQNNLSKFEVEI